MSEDAAPDSPKGGCPDLHVSAMRTSACLACYVTASCTCRIRASVSFLAGFRELHQFRALCSLKRLKYVLIFKHPDYTGISFGVFVNRSCSLKNLFSLTAKLRASFFSKKPWKFLACLLFRINTISSLCLTSG